MAVTPQTNATLQDITRELLRRDNIVICGHVSPDGDCLGSQLALMHALRKLGKAAACVLADEKPVLDESLSFMPGFDELMPAARYDGEVGVFVGVDVPTMERVGAGALLRERAAFSITIDHHAVDTTMCEMVHVDPDAAAAALLVWEIAKALVGRPSAKVAQCAYTGLSTDTGRFQYQNTDARCFEAASEMVAAGAEPATVAREVFQNRRLESIQLEGLVIERMELAAGGKAALSWLCQTDFEQLGATKADAEPMVNTLRSIKGVRVACMLREQDGIVRGSLRAKDNTDVSSLARVYGGGGHKAAAGFTYQGGLDDAVAELTEKLRELVSRPSVDEGQGER